MDSINSRVSRTLNRILDLKRTYAGIGGRKAGSQKREVAPASEQRAKLGKVLSNRQPRNPVKVPQNKAGKRDKETGNARVAKDLNKSVAFPAASEGPPPSSFEHTNKSLEIFSELLPPSSDPHLARQVSANPPPPYTSKASENKMSDRHSELSTMSQGESMEEEKSDELQSESKLAKKQRQRKMLLQEILSSEETYVANLQAVVNCFIVPLKALIKASAEDNIKGAETTEEECT